MHLGGIWEGSDLKPTIPLDDQDLLKEAYNLKDISLDFLLLSCHPPFGSN